jgi:hypothetical protein
MCVMANVFVSYRRRDSRASTGRIADRLRAHFGESAIFQDIQSIGLGVDFRAALMERLDKADVFLAIIGDEWLTAEDEGKRRIEQPDDPVRLEVAGALAREQIPVIPVLVGELPIPDVDDLPDDLKELHYRNAIEIPSDDTFDAQVTKLIRAIEKSIGAPADVAKESTNRSAAPAPSPPPGDRESSGGAGSAKLIAIAAVLVLAAFAVFQFRCELLNQCPNILFSFEGDPVLAMTYGEERELRLVARNDKGEPLQVIPNLEGRYEFDWNNGNPDFLSVEMTDPEDPTARIVKGVPIDRGIGAGKLSVYVNNLVTKEMQPKQALTVTVTYDQVLGDRAHAALTAIKDPTWPTKRLVDEIRTLVADHRDGLPPATIVELELPLAALNDLLDARLLADSDESVGLPVGDRYALWIDWQDKLLASREMNAEDQPKAWQSMERLKSTTRLNGPLQTFSACSRGVPCSGETSNFSIGDKLYVGWTYVRESSSGSETVTLKMPDHEDKQETIEQQEAFTWTWIAARPGGEDIDVQLFNDNGDLIGTTAVSIR